jgi:hypothetical protein
MQDCFCLQGKATDLSLLQSYETGHGYTESRIKCMLDVRWPGHVEYYSSLSITPSKN